MIGAVSDPMGRTAMLEKFERYPLTFGPTPIERLSRLSAHLGGTVEIYAKREDCNSGLAFEFCPFLLGLDSMQRGSR
jgi:hypothetical protein